MSNAQIVMPPCPFCGGPPQPIVQNDSPNRGAAPVRDDYGDDGLYIRAFVFCHECGAEGTSVYEVIYDREDYFNREREAVELWTFRNSRNLPLFDGGAAEGLNLYPRNNDDGTR